MHKLENKENKFGIRSITLTFHFSHYCSTALVTTGLHSKRWANFVSISQSIDVDAAAAVAVADTDYEFLHRDSYFALMHSAGWARV